MKIENKPIKSIEFKNGTIYASIKGCGIMENNPNKGTYLNHVKESIKEVNYPRP